MRSNILHACGSQIHRVVVEELAVFSMNGSMSGGGGPSLRLQNTALHLSLRMASISRMFTVNDPSFLLIAANGDSNSGLKHPKAHAGFFRSLSGACTRAVVLACAQSKTWARWCVAPISPGLSLLVTGSIKNRRSQRHRPVRRMMPRPVKQLLHARVLYCMPWPSMTCLVGVVPNGQSGI